MARLRPLTEDEVDPTVRRWLEGAEQAFGAPLVRTGIQAYAPPILEATRILGAAPARIGKLPAQLRSLVCLRVAQLADCSIAAFARGSGVSRGPRLIVDPLAPNRSRLTHRPSRNPPPGSDELLDHVRSCR